MKNIKEYKYIYFTKCGNCKYCDKFCPVKEEFKELVKDETFLELDCNIEDNLILAKQIFGVKTVPALVCVKDKSFFTLQDISSCTVDNIIDLVQSTL